MNMVDLCVCIGSSCHLKGSYNVVQIFQQMIEEHSMHDKVDLKATFCMRQCQRAGVEVSVNGESFDVLPETARTFFTSTVVPCVH